MSASTLAKNTLIGIVISALLASCLTVGTSVAWGDDSISQRSSTAVLSQEPTSVSMEDTLADSDELLYGYLDSQLFENSDISLLSTSTSYETALNGAEQAIYAQLKGRITNVAAGNEASTEFAVDVQQYSSAYSFEDMGLEETADASAISQALIECFTADINLSKIMTCLMADCPYELYWFDKNTGYKYSWVGNYYEEVGITYFYVSSITFSLDVSEDYSVDGARETLTVDTAKTKAVRTAINNAKDIASEVAKKSYSDLEALTYFKETICNLTSYDYDAMSQFDAGTRGYGDPWQLIYVFDGDTSTNVVCEGYSKAFQYLCELADLESVSCYSMLGTLTLDDGTTENHMWNLVRYNNESYLVDLTNSDEDTIGQSGELFMVNGYSNNFVTGDEYGYTLKAYLSEGDYLSTAAYVYGKSTLSLFENDPSLLALAGSDPKDEGNDDEEEGESGEASDPESETDPSNPETPETNPSDNTMTTTITTVTTETTASSTPKTSDDANLFAIAASLACLSAASVAYGAYRRSRS